MKAKQFYIMQPTDETKIKSDKKEEKYCKTKV